MFRRFRQLPTSTRARRRRTAPNAEVIHSEALEPRVLLSAAPGSGPSDHHATMNLVRHEDVTHAAVTSGSWSDPAIWEDGQIPVSGARVLIPSGVDVGFAGDHSETELSTIRVDGELNFSRETDSRLLVETLVVTHMGRLEIGTADNPIPRDVNVEITFADPGEINTETDPLRMGRGLIVMGSVSAVGAQTRSHVQLGRPARKGAAALRLNRADHHWQTGDTIVVPGVHATKNQDEELTIREVDGKTIVLDGELQYSHRPPMKELSVRVANLSRNIRFESANPEFVQRRGHIMLMHTTRVRIENAAFNGLGRTDKRTPLEDARFDADGTLIDGTGMNQRGRYAVHFHRGGTTGRAAVFRGNSVTDSPGWGVVNHSSNVSIINNTVYHVVGSSFVTEAGDEVGRFGGNFALRSTGSGDGLMERTDQQDFGHRGNGFWFQGSGVEVANNLASGHANTGYIYFIQGLIKDDGSRTEFLTENLRDEELHSGEPTIDPRRVPIPVFTDNTAFAVGDGFQSWFHLQPRKGPQSMETGTPGHAVIDRLTIWNARRRAMSIPYTNGMTIRDAVLIGNQRKPVREAIGINKKTENIRFENVRIEGWKLGIDVPVRGRNEIIGGRFANVTNLAISMGQDPVNYGVSVKRDADGRATEFVTLTEDQLSGREQQNISMRFARTLNHNNLNSLFVPSTIRVDTEELGNRQLFFRQQSAEFVPFKNNGPNIPDALVGLSNAELQEQYGLATGAFIPSGEVDPAVNAFSAEPVTMPKSVELLSPRYPDDSNYRLVYSVDGRRTREAEHTELSDGWNLLTRTIDGAKRTLVVFGDSTTPRFKLQPITPRSLNPVDRHSTIYIVGQILDDSLARRTFKRPFSMSDFKLRTTDEGRDYVLVRFDVHDRSGNAKNIRFRVYFDDTTPPLYELYRNETGPRTIPDLLLDGE